MVYFVNPGIRPKEESPEYGDYFTWMNGDFDKVELYDRTPDGGGVIARFNTGRPLKPANMPTAAERFDPNKKPTPLLDVENLYGKFCINHVFKDILEELEPETHQFFPVEIFQKGAKIADYFWLNVCNRLETYHSDLTYPRNARGFYKPVKGEPSSIVFSTEAIGDHHMWIDKFQGGPFISDVFAQRLQSAGLTGIGFHEGKQA